MGNKSSEKKFKSKRDIKDVIFYACLLAWPVIYFIVFYVCVNFNSILLAFKEYDVTTNVSTFVGFDNFKRAFINFTSNADILYALRNSFIRYIVGIVVGLTLNLSFAYFISKGIPLSNFFKIVLFLPQIISSMSLVVIFTFSCERLLPSMFPLISNDLLANPNKAFPVLIFFGLWSGFGSSMLIYLGAFNNVSLDISEAARIDGASQFREFWSIGLPMIYPTLSTFLTVGVVGVFTEQMSLLEFFPNGATAKIQTIGYYLFYNTLSAKTSEYPYLSALGLIMTAIAAPLTFFVKWALKKYGPSVD